MAPVGSAGCPSVCPLAGFTALAVSTGCRRQLFSSVKILLPFRAKKQVQITTTQVNAKTSFLSPGIAVTLSGPLCRREWSIWSLPEKGLVSADDTQDLSRTSQGPSSTQMEVIWLRPCADFTNNYVILVHTHSHITSF